MRKDGKQKATKTYNNTPMYLERATQNRQVSPLKGDPFCNVQLE